MYDLDMTRMFLNAFDSDLESPDPILSLTVGVKLLPPVVSGRFVGHVPWCTTFPFAKSFVGQVKPRGEGSNLTPTVTFFL